MKYTIIVNSLFLLLLGIFYIFSIGSILGIYNYLSFPYRGFILFKENDLKNYLAHTETFTDLDRRTVEYLYKKNPVILDSLCKIDDRLKIKNRLFKDCWDTYTFEPENVGYLRQYLMMLFLHGSTEEIRKGISSSLQFRYPSKELLPFDDDIVKKNYNSTFFNSLPNKALTVHEYISQIYYLLGFSALNENPYVTEHFWTAARDLSPEWGYFHVELASLEYHELGNQGKAAQVLTDCKIFTLASAQCVHTDIQDSVPGDAYDYIKAIPALR